MTSPQDLLGSINLQTATLETLDTLYVSPTKQASHTICGADAFVLLTGVPGRERHKL